MLNKPLRTAPRTVNGDGGFIPNIPNTGYPIFDKACYGLMVHFRGQVDYDQVAAAVNDAALRGAQNPKAYAKKTLQNSELVKEKPPITDHRSRS